MSFNLRATVRTVLNESADADPSAIAAQVMTRIPDDESRAALQQSLRLFVRQVISEERVALKPQPLERRAPGSWKVKAIRDGWQKRLKDRVHIGDGQWKFLAKCSYEDLTAAATERRELAERNQAWARQYAEWAALVVEHGVAEFGQLPAEVLMNALGRAA